MFKPGCMANETFVFARRRFRSTKYTPRMMMTTAPHATPAPIPAAAPPLLLPLDDEAEVTVEVAKDDVIVVVVEARHVRWPGPVKTHVSAAEQPPLLDSQAFIAEKEQEYESIQHSLKSRTCKPKQGVPEYPGSQEQLKTVVGPHEAPLAIKQLLLFPH